VLFSVGVVAVETPVDPVSLLGPGPLGNPVPLEVSGGAIPPVVAPEIEGLLPLAGAGPANAADIVPITMAATEKAIGNFIWGSELTTAPG